MNTASLLESSQIRRVRRVVAFTLIELLTVISIIGILAGLLVGLAPAAGAKMKESRVRGELAGLVNAIEQYKSRNGFYPPDNYDPTTGVVDPVVNPLYYELSGMVVIDPYDATKGRFRSLDGDEEITPTVAQKFFNRDGFANSQPQTELKRVLQVRFKKSQHGEISTNPDVEVLIVGVPWPLNAASNALKANPDVLKTPSVLTLNPWRYVSTKPVHNPDSYDLWAEVILRGQKRIIGNWKE